jgi:hypothetical protein
MPVPWHDPLAVQVGSAEEKEFSQTVPAATQVGRA